MTNLQDRVNVELMKDGFELLHGDELSSFNEVLSGLNA